MSNAGDDASSDHASEDPEQCEEEGRDCKKASTSQLISAGIFDAHSYKKGFVGGSLSKYDICACKDGTIVIRGQGLCGKSGPTIPTWERWK